jgi:hypothetical protein
MLIYFWKSENRYSLTVNMANQIFLIIEFLDELVFGVIEAAKPIILSTWI